MLKDFLEELKNHKAELQQTGFYLPFEYRSWDYYGKKEEISLAYCKTNLHGVYLTLQFYDEEYSITFNVDCNKRGTYKDFDRLSTKKTYTQINIDLIKNWLKYMKGVIHIINQKEDICQKVIGTGIRQAKILQDDLL